MPNKRRLLGHFWPQFAFVWHQKCARFRTSTTSKSFLCTKTLSSFRQKKHLFAFARFLSPARFIPICFALLCRPAFRGLPGPSCDNQYRLPQVNWIVKKKVQATKSKALSYRTVEQSAQQAIIVKGRLGKQPPVAVPGCSADLQVSTLGNQKMPT
jgi:hypothetical protein